VPVIVLRPFTVSRDVMGEFANRRITTVGVVLGGAVVPTLNLVLLPQTFGMPIPGLG
jgi:manganese transport protein